MDYLIIFFIVFIAIFAIIGLIFWLLSLIAKKFQFTNIAKLFRITCYIFIAVFIIYTGIAFGLLALAGIVLLAEKVTNFFITLVSGGLL